MRTGHPVARRAAVLAVATALLLAPHAPAARAAAPATPASRPAAPTAPPSPTPVAPRPSPSPAAESGAGGAATPARPGQPPARPTEAHGGVPYDPARDRGCAGCGPNGRPESGKDRVYRWADDCGTSDKPACRTRDGAVADSVARLYSEHLCNGEDWSDSGFAAPPPDWDRSPHNDPALFASQTCAGGGGSASPGGGGGTAGGGVAGIARALVAGLDFKALLAAVIRGLWEVLVGDGIEQLGGDIARLLLATPDLRADGGGMGNVQRLVDDLRYAAMFACIVAFALTVVQFLLGQEQAPQAALGRLGAVLVGLGFYRQLVGWLVRGANEVAVGVLAAGGDRTTPAFTGLLKALVPAGAAAALPLFQLLALAGALLVVAIGAAKILGFAFLLLTYVAGPLLLPLGIHPRTAGWVGAWAEHLVKALLWPALWALEFRLFGALAGGLTLLDAGGGVSGASLAQGSLGALTALAMLALMAGTPWAFHTQFTLKAGAQALGRQVGRAADAAAVVATGGAAVSVRGAVAHTIRAQAAARAGGDGGGASTRGTS